MPKFFFKANNDVISHCTCVDEPAASIGQLDCPWCGCGWLISCSVCLKAFTFAEVKETNIPLIELGRREISARGLTNVTEKEIVEWAAAMAETLDHFEVGDVVIHLDGSYFTVNSSEIDFDGYFARHTFVAPPHAEALTDPSKLRAILGEKSYWLDRELPDREW